MHCWHGLTGFRCRMFGCYRDFGFVSGLSAATDHRNGRMFTQEKEGLGNRMTSRKPHGWRHGFGLDCTHCQHDGRLRVCSAWWPCRLGDAYGWDALSLMMDAGWQNLDGCLFHHSPVCMCACRHCVGGDNTREFLGYGWFRRDCLRGYDRD